MAAQGSSDSSNPTPIGMDDISDPTPGDGTAWANWELNPSYDAYVSVDAFLSTLPDGSVTSDGPLGAVTAGVWGGSAWVSMPIVHVTNTDYSVDARQRIAFMVKAGQRYLIQGVACASTTTYDGDALLVLRVKNSTETTPWQQPADVQTVYFSGGSGYNRTTYDRTVSESYYRSDTGVVSRRTYGFHGQLIINEAMSGPDASTHLDCAWNYARRALASAPADYYSTGCPAVVANESRGVADWAGVKASATHDTIKNQLSVACYAAEQEVGLHNIEADLGANAGGPAPTGTPGNLVEQESDSCSLVKLEFSPDEKSDGGSYASGVTVDWYAVVQRASADMGSDWGPGQATWKGNAAGPESFTAAHAKLTSYAGGLSDWVEVPFQDAYDYETTNPNAYAGGLTLVGLPSFMTDTANPVSLAANDSVSRYRADQFGAIRATARPTRYREWVLPNLNPPLTFGGDLASTRSRFWRGRL